MGRKSLPSSRGKYIWPRRIRRRAGNLRVIGSGIGGRELSPSEILNAYFKVIEKKPVA